jgi:hypothetical protein
VPVCTAAPLADGAACMSSADCAGGHCGGAPPTCSASAATCGLVGAACTANAVCCGALCVAGACATGCTSM